MRNIFGDMIFGSKGFLQAPEIHIKELTLVKSS